MFLRCVALALAVSTLPVAAQVMTNQLNGRLVVVYRGADTARSIESFPDVRRAHALTRLGASILTVDPALADLFTAQLRRNPEVEAVLQDRYVQGHAMLVKPTVRPISGALPMLDPEAPPSISQLLRSGPMVGLFMVADTSYQSPAGWAVRAVGGYGDNVPGGSATGPWNVSKGAGVRIAVLDSGIDEHHADLLPNVALNMTEVDQTALPSACDDGSPQDQQGHGTWAASLAAGALGGGEVVGVAPQATLLNIKVLQRMPASTGATVAAQCEAGQTGGLLSWVLTGIDDAIAQRADVISLSLGTLVDLTTRDGAGWKATFDRVTYAATQAGVVIVAAAGIDGLDLSPGRYVELPAQARGVLAVTASTNPACAENLQANATCVTGPVARSYYSNHGIADAVAAPGGSYPAGADPAVSGWIRGACSAGLPNTVDGLPADGDSFGCFGLGHVAYVQAMGTSASAPLLAGAVALVRAAHPGWTSAQIVAALRSTATPMAGMAEPEVNLPAALLAQ